VFSPRIKALDLGEFEDEEEETQPGEVTSAMETHGFASQGSSVD
jgi:hypothetical protein